MRVNSKLVGHHPLVSYLKSEWYICYCATLFPGFQSSLVILSTVDILRTNLQKLSDTVLIFLKSLNLKIFELTRDFRALRLLQPLPPAPRGHYSY